MYWREICLAAVVVLSAWTQADPSSCKLETSPWKDQSSNKIDFLKAIDCFESVFNDLKVNNKLDDDEVLLLYFYLDETLQDPTFADQSADVRKRYKEVERQVGQYKNVLVHKLEMEVPGKTFTMAKRISHTFGAKVLNFYLPVIAHLVYKPRNNERVVQFLEYASNLPEASNWCTSAEALTNEMEKQGQLEFDDAVYPFMLARFVVQYYPNTTKEDQITKRGCYAVIEKLNYTADVELKHYERLYNDNTWQVAFDLRPKSIRWSFVKVLQGKMLRDPDQMLALVVFQDLFSPVDVCLALDVYKSTTVQLPDEKMLIAMLLVRIAESSLDFIPPEEKYLYRLCAEAKQAAPKWARALVFNESFTCAEYKVEEHNEDLLIQLLAKLQDWFDTGTKFTEYIHFALTLKDAQNAVKQMQCSSKKTAQQERKRIQIQNQIEVFQNGLSEVVSDWSNVKDVVFNDGFLSLLSSPLAMKAMSVAVVSYGLYFRLANVFVDELVPSYYNREKNMEDTLRRVFSLPYLHDNCETMLFLYNEMEVEKMEHSILAFHLWLYTKGDSSLGDPSGNCSFVSQKLEGPSLEAGHSQTYLQDFDKKSLRSPLPSYHTHFHQSISWIFPYLVEERYTGRWEEAHRIIDYLAEIKPFNTIGYGLEALVRKVQLTGHINDYEAIPLFVILNKCLLFSKVTYSAGLPRTIGYTYCQAAQNLVPNWAKRLLQRSGKCEDSSSDRHPQLAEILSTAEHKDVESQAEYFLSRLLLLLQRFLDDQKIGKTDTTLKILLLSQEMDMRINCGEWQNLPDALKARFIPLQNALHLYKKGVNEFATETSQFKIQSLAPRFAFRLVNIFLSDLIFNKSLLTSTDIVSTLVEVPEVIDHCTLLESLAMEIAKEGKLESEEAFQVWLLATGGAAHHPDTPDRSEQESCVRVVETLREHILTHVEKYYTLYDLNDGENIYKIHTKYQYSMSWFLPQVIEKKFRPAESRSLLLLFILTSVISFDDMQLSFIKRMPWLNDDCIGLDALVGEYFKRGLLDSFESQSSIAYLKKTMAKTHYPQTPLVFKKYCERAEKVGASWLSKLRLGDNTNCTISNWIFGKALEQDGLHGPWNADVRRDGTVSFKSIPENKYLSPATNGTLELSQNEYVWSLIDAGHGLALFPMEVEKETKLFGVESRACAQSGGKCVHLTGKTSFAESGQLWKIECANRP